jgi:hypothetical protein
MEYLFQGVLFYVPFSLGIRHLMDSINFTGFPFLSVSEGEGVGGLRVDE